MLKSPQQTTVVNLDLPPSTDGFPVDGEQLVEAIRHSYRVGLSGGGATLLSVATMMWLHTIVTYQQRHGTKFSETARHLWRDGGPRRFYRGLLPSLAVAPVCRFGDTLSNELAMTLLQGGQDKARAGRASDGEHGGEIVSRALPVWVATFFGSLGAAVFHAAVVPLDTYKVWVFRRCCQVVLWYMFPFTCASPFCPTSVRVSVCVSHE